MPIIHIASGEGAPVSLLFLFDSKLNEAKRIRFASVSLFSAKKNKLNISLHFASDFFVSLQSQKRGDVITLLFVSFRLKCFAAWT
jgi:hypothetical protein